MISGTGWTWEYVDEQVTLPVLFDLYEYWKTDPPVNELVRCYLFASSDAKKQQDEEKGSMQDMMREMAGAASMGAPPELKVQNLDPNGERR